MITLPKLPFSKKGQWAALTPNNKKVIGYGKTLKYVLLKAKSAKINNPTVLKIGPFSSSFVGGFNEI